MDVESRPGIFAPTQTDANYLHQSGVAIYNADKRTRNDLCFTITYVLLAAVTTFWGIAAFVHTDPNSTEYTLGFYQNSTTCNVDSYQALNPIGASSANLTTDATFSKSFKQAVSIWLPISAALAVGFSVVYVILFRKFAKLMVALSIIVSIGFTVALGVVCILTGVIFLGVILFILAAIAAVIYFLIRRNLELCAELLALSARSLYENVALVPTAIGIKFVGAGILTYCFAAFFSALEVGQPKRNPAFTSYKSVDPSPENATCVNKYGDTIDCCVFQTQGWAAAYAVVCAIFISWTAMLILEIKLFVVADTVAQWYFSAPAPGMSAAVGGSSSQSNLSKGSVKMALRHCLVNSFGSVAFAAAIIAIINFIRRMLERAARNNIICCIINCIAQPILAIMERFTRFATIATAITGQNFTSSARTVFETLKRNFLQTYTMWWVPERVLGITVFLISLSWSAVVFGATYGMTKNKGGDTKWGVPIVTAILAFILVVFVLNFMAGMLLDAVNSLYICYALDKDNRRVTHPEVHSMFAQIPGLAVENPDGNIMYGAPDAAHQQPMQAPAQPYASGYPAQPQYTYPAQQYPYQGPQQQQPYMYPSQQPYPAQQPYGYSDQQPGRI